MEVIERLKNKLVDDLAEEGLQFGRSIGFEKNAGTIDGPNAFAHG